MVWAAFPALLVSFEVAATSLPTLTLLAIEEPENNLAPYFLSRVVQQLVDATGSGRAQALISSHSASVSNPAGEGSPLPHRRDHEVDNGQPDRAACGLDRRRRVPTRGSDGTP